MSKETYIPVLLQVFRQYGYDAASLSKISEATGMRKASLYHYFPGGKNEMVKSVLDYLEKWFNDNVVSVLEGEGDTVMRFQQMCNNLSNLYEEGQKPSLCATLLLGSARDVFHDQVKALFQNWIKAIARVLVESGIDEELAFQRAEDAVIEIQGALILSLGLEDPNLFQRIIKNLPQELSK